MNNFVKEELFHENVQVFFLYNVSKGHWIVYVIHIIPSLQTQQYQ